MDFLCPVCNEGFDSQDDLGEHVKAYHPVYYQDTFLLMPVVNDLATIAIVNSVVTTPPPLVSTTEVDAESDGCCGLCCCCGDEDNDLLGCGCDCDGCCGFGDCFGCGDCIGCGDCPSCGDCCSFDCSIM